MSAVEQATERWESAQRELIAAAAALRAAVTEETKATISANGRHRRSSVEADEMALRVQQMHREQPKLHQHEIGAQVGISRDMVGYYLSQKCKAPKSVRLFSACI